MADPISISAILDEPLPWVLAAFTIAAPALSFFLFLWLFRITRKIFVKRITCPEQKRRAQVELIAQVGELGPYRDVRACSLLEGERVVTCRKGCLASSAVLETPFIIVTKP